MGSPTEGLAIARERIALEKKLRAGFLDLGQLGLEAWPEELWELEHLNGLNLGSGWSDADGNWHSAASDSGGNNVPPQQARWEKLPHLRLLSFSSTALQDLDWVPRLPALQSLNCAFTQVSSLEPLSGLPHWDGEFHWFSIEG
jgi:Leucine-rich repeat (LRR) protein